MTITTIYNPGDTVWCMSNNKVICTKTVNLGFSMNDKSPIEDRLHWNLEAKEMSFVSGMMNTVSRTESELFKTKEELLASL